jgi:hypothetical protein
MRYRYDYLYCLILRGHGSSSPRPSCGFCREHLVLGGGRGWMLARCTLSLNDPRSKRQCAGCEDRVTCPTRTLCGFGSCSIVDSVTVIHTASSFIPLSYTSNGIQEDLPAPSGVISSRAINESSTTSLGGLQLVLGTSWMRNPSGARNRNRQVHPPPEHPSTQGTPYPGSGRGPDPRGIPVPSCPEISTCCYIH